MAKKAAAVALIPASATFAEINGQEFVRIKEAAKLAGIHPVILEMGQRLLSKANTDGGVTFMLGTPDMRAKGAEIEALFKTGLRKVAKAFKPNVKYKVKTHRNADRIVCWYSA